MVTAAAKDEAARKLTARIGHDPEEGQLYQETEGIFKSQPM
jgi:hypothetical protein